MHLNSEDSLAISSMHGWSFLNDGPTYVFSCNRGGPMRSGRRTELG